MSFTEALNKLYKREDLSSELMEQLMETIASGNADPVQTAALLVLLHAKGETSTEVAALVKVMRKHAVQVNSSAEKLLDIVGTGGDGHDTVNISTAASVVAASCGAMVAKHGNRSVSSKSGSSDVLETLGVPMLNPDVIADCIDQAGISFMFAPKFHPAMKYVVPIRKTLGVRTVFNILGPLLNPAGCKRLMLGVYTPDLLQTYGDTLHAIGVEHALVVHCQGLDELAAVGPAQAVEITPTKGVQHITIDPQAFGIKKCTIADLKGGDAAFNANKIRQLFSGEAQFANTALADTIALNAGAGLYVYGLASSIQDGYNIALAKIKTGEVLKTLDNWAKVAQELDTNGPSKKMKT